MESNHTRVSTYLLFSVFMLSCMGRGFATTRSVVQEILTDVYKQHSQIRKTGRTAPHWSVVDPTTDIV
jgi:hypothetical protein